ncbi:hypothetical protein EW145_g2876 [Phellinidium pouzarii]|uniref:Enoyl reductase (ER) domain-containing protein n=1 Tax=Phellinidium pouzarii TaxID=167371 RepID=A0A4S4L9M1_9AGAM|nr:hypothetical protein EW145_g2876 [Phellinidium pouzarii]
MSMQKVFKGYGLTDAAKWSDLSVIEFPSKRWEEADVEIAITHCGHEIAGIAGDHYPDGVPTMGGYATGIIAHEQFVFPIPDELSSEDAASMLCGGLTVFSPLIHNGVGPGKKVGIVSIGGLGHYAILFAKALGAEVYAFSHSSSKAEDAKKMGADHFIETSLDGFHTAYEMELDLLISTRDVAKDFPLADFFSVLHPLGKFVTVGVPNEDLPGFSAYPLCVRGISLSGSHVGSKKDALQMFALAAEKNIKPWIEVLPMKDAKKALFGMWEGRARYRYVLEQDIEVGHSTENIYG